MVEKRVAETRIEISRICNFLDCTEQDIKAISRSKIRYRYSIAMAQASGI